MQAFEVWYLTSKDVASTEQHQSLSSEYIDYTYTFLRLHKFQTTPASFINDRIGRASITI